MYYSKDKRGIYILRTMEDISLNGDAYTTAEALFKVCQRNDRRLSLILGCAGNILPDLLALECPSFTLKTTHRQFKDATGLVHNTMQFSSLSRASDLVFDDSFQLVQLAEKDIQAAIRDEAVKRYLARESIQVLSPFNKATDLSVQSLNQAIQPLVNPPFEDKHSLKLEKGPVFWDSDRVMATKNDRERRCCNGDVGIFRIRSQPHETPDYSVALPDGRRPTWDDTSGLVQQQGYTQEALAEAVDLSAPFVSHIERATKKASLETIRSGFMVLGTSFGGNRRANRNTANRLMIT